MNKTQKTTVKLSTEDNYQFSQAHAARMGAVEAAEMMAAQLQRLTTEAQAKVQKCYEQAAAKHGLNLKCENWQYDPKTGSLRLTGIRYDA